MDGACDEFLARAALTGDEHGEVVALQTLNLVDHAVHHRTRREEAWQQRFERPVDRGTGWRRRAVARRAEREALARHGRKHVQAAFDRVAECVPRDDGHRAWAVGVTAECIDEGGRAGRERPLERHAGVRAGVVRVAAERCDHSQPAGGVHIEHDGGAAAGLVQRGHGLVIKQLG